jgi:hypothetical protein
MKRIFLVTVVLVALPYAAKAQTPACVIVSYSGEAQELHQRVERQAERYGLLCDLEADSTIRSFDDGVGMYEAGVITGVETTRFYHVHLAKLSLDDGGFDVAATFEHVIVGTTTFRASMVTRMYHASYSESEVANRIIDFLLDATEEG